MSLFKDLQYCMIEKKPSLILEKLEINEEEQKSVANQDGLSLKQPREVLGNSREAGGYGCCD